MNSVSSLTVWGSHLLRQERPSGTKDTGDFEPARLDGMSARDEVERRISEWERGAIGVCGHHKNTARTETSGSDGNVRLPPFSRNRERSEARKTAEHLAATRLKVEHRRGGPSPLRNQIGVVPARALFERSTLEPGEVPTMDRCAGGFSNLLLERTSHRK
jgi:hypothetical protein